MKQQLKADLSLLMVTMFWGSSYLFTKIGLESLEPFNLTALRFLIAFIISSMFMWKKYLLIDFEILKYSTWLGVILFSVFLTMTYGVKYTTASNAGFLISLTMVFIPLLSYIIFRIKPQKKLIISLIIALIGIALLTITEELTINFGDALCLLCAILCAFHIIITDRFTRKVDSILLGMLQIGFVGFYSLLASFILETPILPNSTISWISILALSITCTAIGFIVQTYAQQYTTPTHAGLIFSLESVFSAIFSYIFLGEVLLRRGYLGAFLLILSLFIMEIKFKKQKTIG